jgi:hypothetical protein
MQLSMLLWGDCGSGKTTLASTAPGTKLYMLFDPNGHVSLAGRSDVLVIDLSAESPTKVMAQFRAADPYNLGKVLQERPDIETIVVDSITALSYIALQEAVSRAGGSKISIEQPGMQGYTYRNALMLRITVAIMRLCSLHKRHLILVTHEGNADRDPEGHITSVTMALSEGVANQVGLRFNEVWHVTDTGTEHRIAVRPCRMRKPMKTRCSVPTSLSSCGTTIQIPRKAMVSLTGIVCGRVARANACHCQHVFQQPQAKEPKSRL